MDLNKLQQTEAIFQKLPSFFQEQGSLREASLNIS